MRGKYITTTIKLAVLSGGKSKQLVDVKEMIAATGNHKIIWSKRNATKKTVLVKKETVPID